MYQAGLAVFISLAPLGSGKNIWRTDTMSKFRENSIRLLETREKSSEAGRNDGQRSGEKDKNERESGTKNTGKGSSKK